MESTLTEVPQIIISRPDKNTYKKRVAYIRRLSDFEDLEANSFVNTVEYDKEVKRTEVDALVEIGVDFDDGNEPSLTKQLAIFCTQATENFAGIGEVQVRGREKVIAELERAVNRVNKTFKYEQETGSAELNNTIGNPDGTGELIREQLMSGFKENSYLLILKRQRGNDDPSSLHITIPLGKPDEDIPYEEAKISMGTGEFKNISFGDGADQIASSYNSAALKFQSEVIDLQQIGNRLIDTLQDKK